MHNSTLAKKKGSSNQRFPGEDGRWGHIDEAARGEGGSGLVSGVVKIVA